MFLRIIQRQDRFCQIPETDVSLHHSASDMYIYHGVIYSGHYSKATPLHVMNEGLSYSNDLDLITVLLLQLF